jgi:uncharacterized cupin superfamily protein
MRQLAPLVYEWSQYQPDRRMHANSHFVQAKAGEAGVLVDPVPFHGGDGDQVRELGGAAAVVLTRGDRLAEAARCREAFGCPVLVPMGSSAATAVEGAERFAPDTTLPAGLQPIAWSEAPWPGAVSFYHQPSGTIIVGEGIVGAPAGALSLSLDDGRDEKAAERAARSLRPLLSSWVQRVLVAEGEAVLREPERALQDLIYQHDPAAFLLRPEELVWTPPREKGSRFSRRSAECSRLLGLKTLDFEVTTVPPGKQNTLLHRHDGVEEVFIILGGEGEVQTEHGLFAVRAGDVLGFPPRYQVAHAIRNTGDGELRFLSFGAWTGPGEAVGLAEYPESNKQLQRMPGKARIFYLPENLQVDYWEGERLD